MFSFVSSTLRSARARKSMRDSATRQAAWRRPGFEDMENRYSPSSLFSDFAVLDEFGVFQMAGGQLSITNPQTEIGGDTGLGPHAVQNASDSQIDGKFVVDLTANNNHSNNLRIAGGTVYRNLQTAENYAEDAASRIGRMTATQTFNSINNSMTINATQTINVISVNQIQLDGSSTLTLHGSANAYFFINVSGKYSMTGTSAIHLTGGVSTTHVIFNITGTGEQVAFTGQSVGVGTYLAPNRDISVSGATVNGVLIGGENHQIAITSGAHVQVNTPHFSAPYWL